MRLPGRSSTMERMEPRRALRQLGGVAETADLLAFTTAWEFDEAIDAGEIIRVGHGRYALPHVKPARQAAARLSGVVSHLSAAQAHGWEVLDVPDLPWVTVPRNRKVSPEARETASISYGSTTVDVTDRVTDPVRTVLDCARKLSLPQAMAVAESALRHGAVDLETLRARAATLRGNGAGQARYVAEHADGRADNGLESALRAIALRVPGLEVMPQLAIDLGSFTVHPDLVDPEHRLVFEADGWLAHGSTQERFARDLERYTKLILAGWLVLRFGRDEILDHPDRVAEALGAALRLRIVTTDGRAVLRGLGEQAAS
jgi:very-short-patch-repair endonuclease